MTFDISKAMQAQKKLQATKGYPHFAPEDGQCYECRKNIYEEIDHGEFKTGISVEKATNKLITGCPHCHISYCE